MTAACVSTFVEENDIFVKVSILGVKGSTPRNEDAFMLVSDKAVFGTIGGGQLEYQAMAHARSMLAGLADEGQQTIALGPSLGQCCGGRVELSFSIINDDEGREVLLNIGDEHRAKVYVFGFGHVGKALVHALLPLPIDITVVDTRKDQVLNAPSGLDVKVTAIPESVILEAEANAAFVIMTHDHALDFLLTKVALERRDAAYIGMIGSQSKRAKFLLWLDKERSLTKNSKFRMPIGFGQTFDKRPEIIAALTVAELTHHFFGRQKDDLGKVKLNEARSVFA